MTIMMDAGIEFDVSATFDVLFGLAVAERGAASSS